MTISFLSALRIECIYFHLDSNETNKRAKGLREIRLMGVEQQ